MSFSRTSIADFRVDLMFELLTEARRIIRPAIPSKRLRDRLQVRIKPRGLKGDLFLPQFWAVIHHDGRRGFGPRGAKFLVYFVDPDDDPRGPTPDRASDQVRLSRSQFQDALAKNDSLEASNPGAGPFQHMIIVKTPDGDPARVGPARGTPFFQGVAAKRFESSVDGIVFRELDAFIMREIITEEITTTVNLGSLG